MPERKEIPKNCWTCDKSANCYSNYGEGTCAYKVAIEEMERKCSTQMRKEVGSHE
jgi:hypothetical protein